MIRATHIHKKYGNLHVLKGIDLQIAAGEIVAIVGQSGAGKSTLLQILGTLDKADTSVANCELRINDIDVLKMNDRELANFRNQSLGFIFQFHQLLPEFTALENVCLPAFIGKTKTAAAEKEATRLLEFLGLADRLQHRPNELSGGEQQRVAVARALINRPAVVFADEPSGNLDTKAAKHLHQLFFDLRKEFGQTFVIVTHNEELAEMADRKLVISDGKILI